MALYDHIKGVKIKDLPPSFRDPRPDLPEDGSLWSILLTIAHEASPNLYGALHGMRCIGTRLERSKQWGLTLKPILPGDKIIGYAKVGPINVGPVAPGGETITATPGSVTDWAGAADYRAVAQEYLRPHHDLLLGLLKKIGSTTHRL